MKLKVVILRTAEQQNSKTAEQQNSRTAEQQNSRTAAQQNSRTAEQQNSRTTLSLVSCFVNKKLSELKLFLLNKVSVLVL